MKGKRKPVMGLGGGGECATWALTLESRARSGDPEAMAELKRQFPRMWRELKNEMPGGNPGASQQRKKKTYGPSQRKKV